MSDRNRYMVVTPDDCAFEINFDSPSELREKFMNDVATYYGHGQPLTASVFNVIQQMICNPMVTETKLIDGTIILRRKNVQVLIDEALKG